MNAGAPVTTALDGGWRSHELPGLMGTLGPMLTRREDDAWAYALRIHDGHLNQAGAVHGGTITTLADQAISAIAWAQAGKVPCVTVQLNISFLGPATVGQLLVARGRISREAGSLLFLDGTVHANDTLIATAQAVMKRLSGRN